MVDQERKEEKKPRGRVKMPGEGEEEGFLTTWWYWG